MRIELSFAEVAAPLFLNGKNFGVKLTASALTGITLVYDRAEKELWVAYAGKMGIIPVDRVEHMTPVEQSPFLKAMLPPAEAPQVVPTLERKPATKLNKFDTNPLAKAQVGSPMTDGV